MLIYTELEFYNHTQNESWKYRWYPILFKFAYNSSMIYKNYIKFDSSQHHFS